MKPQYMSALFCFVFAWFAANAQTAGIDPALMAKANSGDAAAEVAVGEK